MQKLNKISFSSIGVASALLLGLSSQAMAKDNIVVAFQGALKNKLIECHLKTIARGISEMTGKKL